MLFMPPSSSLYANLSIKGNIYRVYRKVFSVKMIIHVFIMFIGTSAMAKKQSYRRSKRVWEVIKNQEVGAQLMTLVPTH